MLAAGIKHVLQWVATMRIDDIELLRSIDDRDRRGQLFSALTGHQLLYEFVQAAGALAELDQLRVPFAQEVLRARQAGHLTFDDRVWNQHLADPDQDPNMWLQQIRDFRLTAAGRNQARGRVIFVPLPDPTEDDGRLIAGTTLELLARSIGGVYSDYQLPKFLRDAAVPDEFVPPVVASDTKWEYVLGVLEKLDKGGSAARRTLRAFIGGWLDHRLPNDPTPDERRQIITQLARQGWRIQDGRLVISEPNPGLEIERPPMRRDAQIAALHARVRNAAGRFLATDHLDSAVFEAFKAINNRVKAMTGLDSDGWDLMSKVFRLDDPKIALADLATQTGRDFQDGHRLMFMGAMRGIRNPDAHEPMGRTEDDEAFERLAFASMLMRRLDEARVEQ